MSIIKAAATVILICVAILFVIFVVFLSYIIIRASIEDIQEHIKEKKHENSI